MGFLSYLFIESKRNTWLFLFVITSIFAVNVYVTSGASFRVNERFQLTSEEFHAKYYGGSGYAVNKFTYTNTKSSDYDFVFVGDSFGLQYSQTLEEKEIRFAGLFHHGCLILPSYSRWSNNKEDLSCSEEYGKVKSELNGNAKPLLLASSWDKYENILVKKGDNHKLDITIDEYFNIISDELKLTFDENGSDRNYFILGIPQPSKTDSFECLARTELLGFRYFDGCEESRARNDIPINNHLRELSTELDNVYFIDPNDFLCDSERCLTIKNREPIHSDTSHLSIYGAPIVVEGFIYYMNSVLDKDIRQNGESGENKDHAQK